MEVLVKLLDNMIAAGLHGSLVGSHREFPWPAMGFSFSTTGELVARGLPELLSGHYFDNPGQCGRRS